MRIRRFSSADGLDTRHLSVAMNFESGNTLARKLASADLLAVLTGCFKDDAFLMVVFRTAVVDMGRVEMTGILPLLIYNMRPNKHPSLQAPHRPIWLEKHDSKHANASALPPHVRFAKFYYNCLRWVSMQ